MNLCCKGAMIILFHVFFGNPQGEHSCWYYALCCCIFKFCKCCGEDKTLEPIQWLSRFQTWRKEGHDERNVFEILIDIFGGLSNRFDEMRTCRINADYYASKRNDLEFFIPQLCSYAFDDSKPKTLRDCMIGILMEASYASFYFSHKLAFFLHSYEGDPVLSDETRTMYYIND